MIARQHVEPNLFDEAEQLRLALDARFNDPYGRECVKWQYYAVPQLYVYLRAEPRAVFPAELFQRFMDRLRNWCLDTLGLVPMGDPTLHLMLNGHNLSLHSDFHNGTWGYVYSLTRWDQRTFLGGETLLLKDGIPNYKRHHAHGSALYELVPPRFNQLLVFDDRIVHATPAIEGTSDPKQGRIAMVGHIRAGGIVVKGSLDVAVVKSVASGFFSSVAEQLRPLRDVHGMMTYRLRVTPDGAVAAIDVLTNNLVVPVTGYGPSDAVTTAKAKINALLKALRFPAASGESLITIPLLVPVPDLRSIEIQVPCAGDVRARVERHLDGLVYTANGAEIVITEPLAGVIKLRQDTLAASFEAPMWVPSQRAQFEIQVTEALKAASGAP